MSIASIMSKYTHTIKNCTLNTGTIFDLATGNFLPGKDGHMILNGGLFLSNAITGRPQTFKSSIALGYFTRVLQNYMEADGLCYETEMTLPGIPRIIEVGGRDASVKLGPRFENRDIQFFDKTELNIDDLFEVIRGIASDKETRKKELIRETPFMDQSGGFVKSWTPTVILIDSYSAATSSKEIAMYTDNTVGDSKTNMSNMNDGRVKTEFARQIPQICGARGIYLISTAHIGNNNNLDPYAAPAKDLPMMSAKDKLKNVGTQYAFLSTNMLQTRKVELLQDDKKKCQYPSDRNSSDVELQKITTFVTRCKNNVSGASFDHISSQFEGIQEHLEYYHLIKESKSALLEGTQTQKLGITDHEFTRKTVRSMIDSDYTFRRALEILGQFAFVRNRWNIESVNAMGYVDFCKKFNASKTLKEQMLNSTGVWNFNDVKAERPYMSILDIIEMISK